VSTGSTKLRDRKAAEQPGAEPDGWNDDLSPRGWWLAGLFILAAAAFVRLYALGLKPMHHDEGVNGFFLTTLYREGIYHYDPNNYHGPTLYYFALAVTKLKAFLFGEPGLGTIAVRLVPALFGVATVWLVLTLRRKLGAVGALTAAALIALSPGDVYVSRYFIHETHFVFFTLGVVVASLRYWETTDPVYLQLAAVSAALLTATKETATISLVVLGLAWAVGVVYLRLAGRGVGQVPWENQPRQAKGKKRQTQKPVPLERFGGWKSVAPMAALALVLFLFINVLFYSSFFTNWKGVGGAVESLQVWAKTGTKEHGHPWYTYLDWLWQEEAPLLILGVMGAGLALIRRNSRFAVFAGAWAFGILAAYSLIPYKTPWLALNMIVPLAISGGYVFQTIGRTGRMLIATVTLAISGYQTIALNFFRYDQEGQPYVYVHTRREVLGLVDRIRGISERAPAPVTIAVLSREQFPLSWYLRAYPAGYYGGIQPTADPIVIGSEKQERLLSRALGREYEQVGRYPLRPGVGLVLYVRRELLAATRP
jgi:uncharacterized protein (TIGR03663 family)